MNLTHPLIPPLGHPGLACSALPISIALLAKKTNRNPPTSSFLVSALNSLEPMINSADFYLSSPQKCSRGTFLCPWGQGFSWGSEGTKTSPMVHPPAGSGTIPERHNMWELVLKTSIEEVVWAKLSSPNSFSSLHTLSVKYNMWEQMKRNGRENKTK